jgi:tetratricopeptide (TPR) repeat protein
MTAGRFPFLNLVFFPVVFAAWAAILWVRNMDFPYHIPSPPPAPNSGVLSRYFFQEDKLVAGINELRNSLPREKRITERGYIRHNIGILYIKRYKQGGGPALLDTAVTSFSAAVQDNPGIAQAYYNLGRVCMEQGKVEPAAEFYRQAIQADPHYTLALYNLGYFYYQEKKMPDSAQIYIQQAMENNPRLPLAEFVLGCICQDRRQYPEALQHYLRETQNNPDLAPTYAKLSEIYGRFVKDPEKAREAWKRYLNLTKGR